MSRELTGTGLYPAPVVSGGRDRSPGCISGATALLWLYKVSSPPGAVIREASSLPGGHTAAVRAALQSDTGLPVDNIVVFVDCPAYSDKSGTIRCGLPAEVEDRYTMTSTDGPLESARIRCPRGHFFNGPIEAFYWESQSAGQPSARSVSPGRPRPARQTGINLQKLAAQAGS